MQTAIHLPNFIVSSSDNWSKLPGNFDALHATQLFSSDNALGLPVIGNGGAIRPTRLHPYHIRTRSAGHLSHSAVHFYLDDYQFETAWTRPARALSYVQRFQAAITPDFSIWSHWPLALQQWNLYRARWCGAYWMSQGVTVIPSITWAGPETYDFAFAGIRRGSTVALSTVGLLKSSHSRANFIGGFYELLDRIKPSLVLCYGRMPFDTPVEVIEYPTFWEEKKGHA